MSETDLWASMVFALMGGLLVGAIFSSGLEAQEQPTESIRLRIEMQGTAEEIEGLLLSATTGNFIIRSDERLEGRNPRGGGTRTVRNGRYGSVDTTTVTALIFTSRRTRRPRWSAPRS